MRSQGVLRREERVSGLLLIPGVVMLVLFFLVPTISLIRLSLSRWNGLGQPAFIGGGNFSMSLGSSDFQRSVLNSILLATVSAAGIVAIGLSLAWLVSDQIKGAKNYRALWVLPSISPAAAVAVFWALSVQPQSGVINQLLGSVGLGANHAWLSDSSTAMWVVIFVVIWHGVGFAFLLLLGAMEEIPISVHEAAELDGASRWQRFFALTLPLIKPVLATVLLLNLIWAFNGFTFVWGITRGGPGGATETLPILVYRQAFLFGNFGPAAAMSIIGGLILLGTGALSQRMQRRTDS